MPSSYLPWSGGLPWGWPHGTGIVLSPVEGAVVERAEMAHVLVQCGCDPRAALRIADRFSEDGYYATRVTTLVLRDPCLEEFLGRAGLAIEVEDAVPEGNEDHILHHAADLRYVTVRDAPEGCIEESSAASARM